MINMRPLIAKSTQVIEEKKKFASLAHCYIPNKVKGQLNYSAVHPMYKLDKIRISFNNTETLNH